MVEELTAEERHAVRRWSAAQAADIHPLPWGNVARRARRIRRRRSLVLTAVPVIVVLGAVALLLQLSQPDQRVTAEGVEHPPPLGVPARTPVALPDAPIPPRSAHGAVWAGDAMFVWGGQTGGAPDAELLADGALYQAGEWREIHGAPLSQRTRPQVAWTGSEVLVWGGSEQVDGAGSLSDGAAYDPSADRWRPIPAEPVQRASASVTATEGLVAVAGGFAASDVSGVVSVFDVAAGEWSTLELDDTFVDIAAVDGRFVAVGADAARRVVLAVIEPRTATLVDRFELEAEAEQVGVSARGPEAVVLISGRGSTEALFVDPATGRIEARWFLDPTVEAPVPLSGPVLDGLFESGSDELLIVSAGRAYRATESSVEPLDVELGGYCPGSGSSSVAHPGGLLFWSGESCRSTSREPQPGGIHVDARA